MTNQTWEEARRELTRNAIRAALNDHASKSASRERSNDYRWGACWRRVYGMIRAFPTRKRDLVNMPKQFEGDVEPFKK